MLKILAAAVLLSLSNLGAARGPDATKPEPRPNDWWQARNTQFNDRTREAAMKGDIDIIMLGDSITQGWETAGKKAWEEHLAPLNAVNYGIGGDCTHHVLYRIEHGNLEGLAAPKDGKAPRLVAIMIGTNNSNIHEAEEITAGVLAVVDAVRAKLPEAHILVQAIFPRGDGPGGGKQSLQHTRNTAANTLIAAAITDRRKADTRLHYADFNASFIDSAGAVPAEIMPDYLHLSEDGYNRWAAALVPEIKRILAASPEPAAAP